MKNRKNYYLFFAILSSILGYSEVKHEISVTNGVSVLKDKLLIWVMKELNLVCLGIMQV